MSGLAIALIVVASLVVVVLLLLLFSRKRSSPSSNFLDEEKGSRHRAFTPLSSQELSNHTIASIKKEFKGIYLTDFQHHFMVDNFAILSARTIMSLFNDVSCQLCILMALLV
jgi:hypothetical protein